MKRANFYLPESILASLRNLAKATDLSASEHLRRALAAYLSKRKGEKS